MVNMKSTKIVELKDAILLDHDRLNPEIVQIDASTFGSRIAVNGVKYDHVSTNDAGVWEYAPMA